MAETDKKLVLQVNVPAIKWAEVTERIKKIGDKLSGTKFRMGMSKPEVKETDAASYIFFGDPKKFPTGGAFTTKAFRKKIRGSDVMRPTKFEFVIYLESQDRGIYGSIKRFLEETEGVRCELARVVID